MGRLIQILHLMEQFGDMESLRLPLDLWTENTGMREDVLEREMALLCEAQIATWEVSGHMASFRFAAFVWGHPEEPPQPRKQYASDSPQAQKERRHKNGNGMAAPTPSDTPLNGMMESIRDSIMEPGDPVGEPPSAPVMESDSRAHAVTETFQKPTESNQTKNVTVTRPQAATETEAIDISLEKWRRETEDLARYSANELGDKESVGYHVQVWNHARKIDKQRGGKRVVTDGVLTILSELSERRRQSGQHQGKAWTRRTKKWFEDNNAPWIGKGEIDPEEQAKAHAALEHLRPEQGNGTG